MFKFTMKASDRNKHKGKKFVIISNGPSIKEEPLSLLNSPDIITIGVNAAPLLQSEHNFSIDYICVSDVRFVKNEKKYEYLKLANPESEFYFREELRELTLDIKNKKHFIKAIARDGFSKSINHGFFFGASTTLMAIQVAYFLGAENILLSGVDLRYKPDNPRFYKEDSIQIEEASIGIQINNILHAYRTLADEGKNIYISSKYSFLRPYIPHSTIEEFIR